MFYNIIVIMLYAQENQEQSGRKTIKNEHDKMTFSAEIFRSSEKVRFFCAIFRDKSLKSSDFRDFISLQSACKYAIIALCNYG